MSEFKSVSLHTDTQYKEACVDVLSEEWPRSAACRLAMLEKSNEALPYSIVLLERQENSADWQVIGHSRLCKVVHKSNAGFVESVVIRKSRRGLGLGKKLMEETENHALKLGFTKLYLSTHDKQGFYKHLGYTFCGCQPIIACGAGSQLISTEQLEKLFGPRDGSIDCVADGLCITLSSISSTAVQLSPLTLPSGDVPPPPPPPPCGLPPSLAKPTITRVECDWMVKNIEPCS